MNESQPGHLEPTGQPPNPSGSAGGDTTQLPSQQPPSAGTSGHGMILMPGMQPVPEYELVQLLGHGGYGEVWKAHGPGGVLVALKFIRLDARVGEVELRSLGLMKNIHHPHLTGIAGIWQREGLLIIAMELGDATLTDALLDAQRAGLPGIPVEPLCEYMREAAKGIDYLCTVHIVHRDIKPKNLLLVGGGVKVADFGLAKFLEQALASSSGAMTPSYAAPEFFRGEASSQSDQYALAVSYCELRGGRLPFTGSVAELMAGHLMNPPDLSMLPEPERPVVARALAKNPSERWPDCRSFVRALEPAAFPGLTPSPDTITNPRPVIGPRREFTGRLDKNGWRALCLLLTGVGILGGALAFWLRIHERDPLVQMRAREIEREVSLLKSAVPLIIRERAEHYREVDRWGAVDNSAFDVISDERIIDLRLWKEVPPEKLNELFCAVNMTRRVRLRKNKPVREYDSQVRTSGLDVFSTCLSPYPFSEIGLKGETFVGMDRMKSRRLLIDVSTVPESTEFDLRTADTFWNTAQTERELWFGIIGYNQSFKVSMYMLFPPTKPYKDFTLMVSRTVKDQPTAYNGPKLLLSGPQHDWIYWEVPNPREGYVFRLHWNW
jgi:serine/threonine protein kinase